MESLRSTACSSHVRASLLCLAGAAGLTGLASIVGCGCGRSGSTGSGPSIAPALAESAPRTALQSLDRVGSYETHFLGDGSNHRFWPLPNIIGFAAR